MVNSSTNPPPPPPIRPQRVRSRSRSASRRNHSNSCNDLQQQRIIDNSSPPSQMLSSLISSPTNNSSSSSSGKRRWRNPFNRSNSTGTGQSPSPIYNRPTLSQSQSHSRPNNSRGRTSQQGVRSNTAPRYISQGIPSPPFSNDVRGSRSGSAPTSHSNTQIEEKVNTSCAQNNNQSRSSSRGRLQRPTSGRRLADRTTKQSRSPPPLLERRAVYQPVCNSGNIAKKSTQHSQPHSNNVPTTRQPQQQNHDRRSYDLNSELVNSIREIYHIIPAPPPQQQNASQNVETSSQKQNGISPPNSNSTVSNGSKSPNNPRTVASIRSQPPPPPPKRNQLQKQAPPPPPRVLSQSNNNLSEFVIYTPEEFERVTSAANASAGQQLIKYPPPPPKQQLQQQHEQQKGTEEGSRKPARRRRSRSNDFGLSSSLVKRLSKDEEEEGNVNTSFQQLLDISESTREGLPFDIIPTTMKQEGEGPLPVGQTYRRTKSQDNVSSFHTAQGQDEYNMSNMTFNLGEFRDTLDKGHEERGGERRLSFMTKTRRQLSHAQEVIALVANPTASSSSNASKTASQNDIEHHQQQQQQQQQGEDEGSNKQHLGFRNDYGLGDTARTSSHMIIETDTQRAIESVGTLSSHDFAFVKRSDGSYSYSILAYRSSSTQVVEEESLITRPPQLQQGEVEESMTFVLSNAGCTKLIKKSQWSQCIRLVASEEEDGTAQSLPVTVLQSDKTSTTAKEKNEAPDQDDREVQSNPDVEIYLKKIRDQTYNTTTQEEKKQPLLPGEPGWKPPDTLAFNTNMDDDLISCISTPMGLPRENDDGQDKKIALSTQPVIQE